MKYQMRVLITLFRQKWFPFTQMKKTGLLPVFRPRNTFGSRHQISILLFARNQKSQVSPRLVLAVNMKCRSFNLYDKPPEIIRLYILTSFLTLQTLMLRESWWKNQKEQSTNYSHHLWAFLQDQFWSRNQVISAWTRWPLQHSINDTGTAKSTCPDQCQQRGSTGFRTW